MYVSFNRSRAQRDCGENIPVRPEPDDDRRSVDRLSEVSRPNVESSQPDLELSLGKRKKIGTIDDGEIEIPATKPNEDRSPTTARPETDETSTPPSRPRWEKTDEIREWLERRLDASRGPTSPDLREQMWNKAGAVGGPQAFEEWQNAIDHWRQTQSIHRPIPEIIRWTPDPMGTLEWTIRRPQLAQVHPDIQAFCQVYERLDESEMDDTIHAVKYRVCSATLYQTYERATVFLEQNPPVGQTKASAAKLQLFRCLYPARAEGMEPRKIISAKWTRLTTRLSYAKRWAFIRDRLGVGIFWVMPRGILSHSFVEQTLRRWNHLEVWIELVQKRNPHAIRLGEATMNQIQGMLIRPYLFSKRRILDTLTPLELAAYLAREKDPTTLWDTIDEKTLTGDASTSC